jgi:hypothetical protein
MGYPENCAKHVQGHRETVRTNFAHGNWEQLAVDTPNWNSSGATFRQPDSAFMNYAALNTFVVGNDLLDAIEPRPPERPDCSPSCGHRQRMQSVGLFLFVVSLVIALIYKSLARRLLKLGGRYGFLLNKVHLSRELNRGPAAYKPSDKHLSLDD